MVNKSQLKGLQHTLSHLINTVAIKNIAASSNYWGQAQSDDKTCQHCWKCQTNCNNEQL